MASQNGARPPTRAPEDSAMKLIARGVAVLGGVAALLYEGRRYLRIRR